MSHSPKNQIDHSHLIKQPSFKHLLMAALVISLGGTLPATWAGENVTTTATPSTATASTTFTPKYCTDRAEFLATHQQDRTQRRTEAFQRTDSNKDGNVNLTEYLESKPHHRGKADGQISKAEAEVSAPRIAKRFTKIDANHDGLISQDELKASYDARKAKWSERSAEKRTKAFAKADANNDGQLTQTEWLAFKAHHHGFWHNLWKHWFGNDNHQRHDQAQHQSQRGNLFKKVDSNDDKQISLSEAQANAPRLAQHFNEIDTDRNGQISHDERRTAFKAACAKSNT